MYPQTLREGSLISSTVWVRIFLCLYKRKEDIFFVGGGGVILINLKEWWCNLFIYFFNKLNNFSLTTSLFYAIILLYSFHLTYLFDCFTGLWRGVGGFQYCSGICEVPLS